MKILRLSSLDDEKVRLNGPRRCYYCKLQIFSAIQREVEKGEGDSRFLLSYRVEEKLLCLTRKGSAEMELRFREGEMTDGVMHTSHGDFDLQVETFGLLFFPETADEEAVIDGKEYLVRKAIRVKPPANPTRFPTWVITQANASV